MDIRFYLSLFFRRFHWFLLVALLGAGAGLTLATVLPPVYVARAKLLVESEQIPGELAASTVSIQALEQIEIIRQRILTRDTLIEMANRLEIYGPRGTARPMDGDRLVEDMRERIRINTSGGTVTRGQMQATLVDVSFDAPAAGLAATVANELVTLILRADVAMRTGTARQTLEFFEQEVARLERELSERGAAILAFKEANKDALPDSLDFRRNQLVASQERLLTMQRQEAELRDRRERLVRLYEASGGAILAPQPGQQTTEARRLQQLRDELTSQLAVLAPEHPRIKLLQSQIEALERVVALQGGTGATDLQGQEMTLYELQLAELDGQLDYLARQQEQINATMQALQVSIEATPGNAITLDRLERDAANTRAQYDHAVAAKARAETGDMIEALSKGQRISVIEQAVAPREPERPRRTLIAAGGVVGGLFGGLGLVLLIEILRPGVRRPEDLTAKLGITPFAVLPLTEPPGIRLRRRLRTALLLVLLVGALAGLLWLIDRHYIPLEQLLGRFPILQRQG